MLYLGPPNWFSNRVYNDLTNLSSIDWPKSTATSIPSRSQISLADWSPDGHLLASAASNPFDDNKIRIWGLDALMQTQGTPACTDYQLPSALCSTSTSLNAISLISWPALARDQEIPSITASDLVDGLAMNNGDDIPSFSRHSTSDLFSTHGSSVPSLPTSSKIDTLISASHAAHLILWDLRKPTGTLLPSHVKGTPIDLALLPRRSHSFSKLSGEQDLMMITNDNYLTVFDTRKLSQPSFRVLAPFTISRSVADPFGPCGSRILIGTRSGELHDLSFDHLIEKKDVQSSIRFSVQAQVGPCNAISIDPKHRFIATSGPDSIINFCSWNTLESCLATSFDQDVPVKDLSFTHDGELITVLSDLDNVASVAVSSGQCVCRTKLPNTSAIPGYLNNFKWNPYKPIAVGTYSTNRPHRGKLVLFQ